MINKMISVKEETKLQEELVSNYYKSLYGLKEDKIRLQHKAKTQKLTKLKKNLNYSNKKSKKKK